MRSTVNVDNIVNRSAIIREDQDVRPSRIQHAMSSVFVKVVSYAAMVDVSKRTHLTVVANIYPDMQHKYCFNLIFIFIFID